MSNSNDFPKDCGSLVSDFSLSTARGKHYSSRPTRSNGLLLIVLFRSGCETCHYSAPFLQRFHTLYAETSGERFQIWGVSQDDEEESADFTAEHGLTFPILLDEQLQVSEDYGVVSVPDLYLLDSSKNIVGAVVGGFSRDGFNALAQQIAGYLGVPYQPVVRDEDKARLLKPG